MQISAINCCPRPIKFTSKKNDSNYENPINRGTEKGLAVLGTVGASALVGTIAAGLTTCFEAGRANKKLPWYIGAGAMALTLLLTLPSKLYNTKVTAFAKEKEMDVFSRDRDAKSNMLEQINEHVKYDEVPLAEKVNNYAKVQMANNGQGMMIAGV